MILQIMKTKQHFGIAALLGHRSQRCFTWPSGVFDSSRKQMLWIRLHKTFLLYAFMCFSTLRTSLKYQIPILLQVIKKHTCFFFAQGDQL